MKPKILGAWNLHLVSLNIPIDYFVMHSSVVSVIGNPAQCNYAAANSFLDSFALFTRSKGLPAQSINWGPLAVGMAVYNEDVKSKLSRNGFNYLEREQIRDCFTSALINDITDIIYVDIKWDKLLLVPTFSMQPFKYSEVQNSKQVHSNASKPNKFDFSTLLERDAAEGIALVRAAMKGIIKEILVTEEDFCTDQSTLADLGMDSMAAMSLSNAIDETFQCHISITVLLSDSTTVSTIVEHIIRKIEQNSELGAGQQTAAETDDADPKKHLEQTAFIDKEIL